MSAKLKLLFVVTEDWYFLSHRLPTVYAAQDAGFDVGVVTNVGAGRAEIEAQGVKVIPFSFDRRSLNPFKALGQIARLRNIYREEKPAMVHHIAMKPVLYGSVAAAGEKVPCVINAFAGLGYVFNARTFLACALRPLLLLLYRFLLKRPGSYLLLQNEDDKALLGRYGLIDEARLMIVKGSGVDLDHYKALPFKKPEPDVICAFAGRMVGIKGLPTLKAAFQIIGARAPHIKLWLCGQPDEENPGSFSEQQLQDWQETAENVIYKGFCPDMTRIWQDAHIAVQPSYGGEGLPKSLLEAAASARAIVATDVPGCREVVQNDINGYLVPPYDTEALARAIITTAADPGLCEKMGAESRRLVAGEMSADAVRQKMRAFYERCRRETGCG